MAETASTESTAPMATTVKASPNSSKWRVLAALLLFAILNYAQSSQGWREINSSGLGASTMNSTTSTIGHGLEKMTEDLSPLHDYNLCRSSISPRKITYRCEGPKYDRFADHLEAYISVNLSSTKPPLWGKRPLPFPPGSTILLLGNSHSRQISTTLYCQYLSRDPHSVERIRPYENQTTDSNLLGSYEIYRFPQGVTLHELANHPYPYSANWQRDLEATIGQPLSSIDGLIIGHFNGLKEAKDTNFFLQMTETLKDNPEAALSDHVPKIDAYARQFQGPIVGHAMFANWGEKPYKEMKKIAKTLERDNIQLIDGRRYIPILGECASKVHASEMGECSNFPSGHRCTGDRGGHADLIAWDILELMNDMLEKKQREYW